MYNDLKGTAHSAQKKYFEASLSTKHIFLFGTEKNACSMPEMGGGGALHFRDAGVGCPECGEVC